MCWLASVEQHHGAGGQFLDEESVAQIRCLSPLRGGTRVGRGRGDGAGVAELGQNQIPQALSKLTQHVLARPMVNGANSRDEAKWPFVWAPGRELNAQNPRDS